MGMAWAPQSPMTMLRDWTDGSLAAAWLHCSRAPMAPDTKLRHHKHMWSGYGMGQIAAFQLALSTCAKLATKANVPAEEDRSGSPRSGSPQPHTRNGLGRGQTSPLVAVFTVLRPTRLLRHVLEALKTMLGKGQRWVVARDAVSTQLTVKDDSIFIRFPGKLPSLDSRIP